MAFLRVIPAASHRKVLSWFVACLEQLPQQESAGQRSAEAARDSCRVLPPHGQSLRALRNLDRAARHASRVRTVIRSGAGAGIASGRRSTKSVKLKTEPFTTIP